MTTDQVTREERHESLVEGHVACELRGETGMDPCDRVSLSDEDDDEAGGTIPVMCALAWQLAQMRASLAC